MPGFNPTSITITSNVYVVADMGVMVAGDPLAAPRLGLVSMTSGSLVVSWRAFPAALPPITFAGALGVECLRFTVIRDAVFQAPWCL